MAQIIITLAFAALMVFAARMMIHELKRPLVQGPACWDDLLYDAICDGRGGAFRAAPSWVVRARPIKAGALRRPAEHAAAA